MFQYKRKMQFYETDGMGIIHHANYLLVMEEARVEFISQINKDLLDPLGDVNYPLLSCHVDYKKPLYFNDQVTVDFDVQAQAARLSFNYTLHTKRFDKPVAFGKTVHAAFDMKNRRAIRIPESILEFLAQKGK